MVFCIDCLVYCCLLLYYCCNVLLHVLPRRFAFCLDFLLFVSTFCFLFTRFAFCFCFCFLLCFCFAFCFCFLSTRFAFCHSGGAGSRPLNLIFFNRQNVYPSPASSTGLIYSVFPGRCGTMVLCSYGSSDLHIVGSRRFGWKTILYREGQGAGTKSPME
jgi:hypothetical protein